ncbi:MAG: GIY-YIG nuclease family protein [Flavobacteriia bacterium]|nr:GIY-YIG nuclease family protein [Flavobacteriia bacterium]
MCHMYILICGNGTYYTGSTRNLERRLMQHQSGKGAIHTTMHQPVVLIYSEEFSRIDHAFYQKLKH